jgi:hypothetical protein
MTAVLVILYRLEATPLLWRLGTVTFMKFCKKKKQDILQRNVILAIELRAL